MKTCLVVDDSSVIRKVARRILEGLEFQIEQFRQLVDTFLATGRTAIDVRFALSNGRGIGFATGKAALTTLCLGQNCVNLVDQRVAFHVKFDSGKTQHGTKNKRKYRHNDKGDQHKDLMSFNANGFGTI